MHFMTARKEYRVTSSPIQLNTTVIIGTLIELNQANKC